MFGVPRIKKTVTTTSRHPQQQQQQNQKGGQLTTQCHRRPNVGLTSANRGLASASGSVAVAPAGRQYYHHHHQQQNSSPPVQARRKRDGKPVYPSRPSVPVSYTTATPSTIPSGNYVSRRPISVSPSSSPIPSSSPPPPMTYGWCKNVTLLIFGMIILFAVFIAVIAIFPNNQTSTLNLNKDNGAQATTNGDDDDDDDRRRRDNPSLNPFPKQSTDGSCPPGFRPYFSGCILNMPFPRAVDDNIKDTTAQPCKSLNAYACGGWSKYDKDRGTRSFRSAGRWNQRLSEYVRKVNGLREPFSWDAKSTTATTKKGVTAVVVADEEEEILFHLLARSCVHSLKVDPSAATTTPMKTSRSLKRILGKLQKAVTEAGGSRSNARRAVGVMVGTLIAEGIPSIFHMEPLRNPVDRSESVLYLEPWVAIGSDPYYVKKWMLEGNDKKLRAHIELIERACASLISVQQQQQQQQQQQLSPAAKISICAKAALSIEAALIGSVPNIPDLGTEYLASQEYLRRDLIPSGERSMAEAVDANDYRSGFTDGFYDSLVDEMKPVSNQADAIRDFSLWTLGGLEPFFESALGVLLDGNGADTETWLYYFQVVVMTEASHYLPNPQFDGAERVKALLADIGTRGSPEVLSVRRNQYGDSLLPWGRLRRIEPLRGHVTDNALGFTATVTTGLSWPSDQKQPDSKSSGWIAPYETTQDPHIEESEAWRSCLNAAAAYLPEVADDTFSDLVVTKEDRNIVESVASNVLRALLDSVASSPRLSPEAKRRIASKARSIIRRIAHPWKQRPLPHLNMKLRGQNFFDDAMTIRAWNTRESFLAALASLNTVSSSAASNRDHTSKEHDSTSGHQQASETQAEAEENAAAAAETATHFKDPRFGRAATRRFEMPANIPNAYYDPTQNIITILSGIMRPPFFDRRYNNASLYATVGAVIGHELNHAFDTQGIRFDRYGNVAARDGWLPAADQEMYQKAKACYVRQYDGRKTVDGNPDDGSLTVSENIADGMGLRASWMAFVKIEDQRSGGGVSAGQAAEFLEAYAQLWCASVPTSQERRQMTTDPHSPGDLRADGAVQNLRDPQTGISPMELAYGCKRGEATMVPEETCELW